MTTDSSQKDGGVTSVKPFAVDYDILDPFELDIIEVPPVLPPGTEAKMPETIEESSPYVPHGAFFPNTPSNISAATPSPRFLVASPISYGPRAGGMDYMKRISQRSFLDPYDSGYQGGEWGRNSLMKSEYYDGVETPNFLYPRTPSAYGSADGNYLFQTSLSPEEVNELVTKGRAYAMNRASSRFGSYYGADGAEYGYKAEDRIYSPVDDLNARHHWGSVMSRSSWARTPMTPLESPQFRDSSHFAYLGMPHPISVPPLPLESSMPSHGSNPPSARSTIAENDYLVNNRPESWSKGHQSWSKGNQKGGKDGKNDAAKTNAKGGKAEPHAGANAKGNNHQQLHQQQQQHEQKGGKPTTVDQEIPTKVKTNKKKNYGNLKDEPTTVMLRNIPNKYEQSQLLDVMKDKGFSTETFDFFYLPIDFRNRCCVGYAFINFRSHQIAKEFETEFSGYKLPMIHVSPKICEVNFARIQGKKANLDVYRNSALVGIPIKKYRPLCFDVEGNEIPLPTPDVPIPSVQLRAAKIHRGSKRKRDKAKKSSWSMADFTNEQI